MRTINIGSINGDMLNEESMSGDDGLRGRATQRLIDLALAHFRSEAPNDVLDVMDVNPDDFVREYNESLNRNSAIPPETLKLFDIMMDYANAPTSMEMESDFVTKKLTDHGHSNPQKGAKKIIEKFQRDLVRVGNYIKGLKENLAKLGVREATEELTNIAMGYSRGEYVGGMTRDFINKYARDLSYDDIKFLQSL